MKLHLMALIAWGNWSEEERKELRLQELELKGAREL